MSQTQDTPPFALTPADGPRRPFILCSPHSGRDYPPDLLERSRLGRMALRRSEDAFVDELFCDAPALGAPLLAALFPRAYVDVNRETWELDPAMFEGTLPKYVNARSPRVAAGLGSVARVVANGAPIYRDKLRFEDARARLQACWFPYHKALRGLIDETRAAFGLCAVIDAHSMPSSAPDAGGLADVVLGDRHGASCAPEIVNAAENAFRRAGWRTARNTPYAGGFVTVEYGRPGAGAHVLQIEINRALYMHESTIEKRPRFDAVRADIRTVLDAIGQAADMLGAGAKKRGRANAARV